MPSPGMSLTAWNGPTVIVCLVAEHTDDGGVSRRRDQIEASRGRHGPDRCESQIGSHDPHPEASNATSVGAISTRTWVLVSENWLAMMSSPEKSASRAQ